MADELVERHLMLSEDVTQSGVKPLIEAIYKVNRHDDEQEKKFKEYERKPIELIVNTYGGSAYDGLALIGAMSESRTPIHTICLGKAMSMGFIIMACGFKRFMHPVATLMYHQLSAGVWDNLTGIKQEVQEFERIQSVLDSIILQITKIREKELEEVKNLRKDWYINADEALKLGIIDEIL